MTGSVVMATRSGTRRWLVDKPSATMSTWSGWARWLVVDGAVVQRERCSRSTLLLVMDVFYFRFRLEPVAWGHVVGGHVDDWTMLIGQRLWLLWASLVVEQVSDAQLARRQRWRHAAHHVTRWRHRIVVVVVVAGAATPRIIIIIIMIMAGGAQWVVALPPVIVWVARWLALGGHAKVEAEVVAGLTAPSRDVPVHLPGTAAVLGQVSLKLLGADVQPVGQLSYRRLLLHNATNTLKHSINVYWTFSDRRGLSQMPLWSLLLSEIA